MTLIKTIINAGKIGILSLVVEIKNAQNIVVFCFVLLALTIGYFRFYLTYSSEQFSKDFEKQNFLELAKGDVFGLTNRIQAISIQGHLRCIVGKKYGNIFVEEKKGICGNSYFQHETKIRNDQSGVEIAFFFEIPNLLFWGFSFFLVSQLSLFLLLMLQLKRVMHIKIDQAKGVMDLSAQIAHDIRSPLSALNMVTGTLGALPEEKRLLIRNATQRINDIANSLIRREKDKRARNENYSIEYQAGPKLENTMIAALIDSIVSEKRVQFRQKMAVDIQGDLSQGYGLFTQIEPAEISRAISNIINNSVEAFSASGGNVHVSVQPSGSQEILIKISDNGKGISPEVLQKLGTRGVSQGKSASDSGSGLGVYQAKVAVENCGGKFSIESEVGKGTVVNFNLPKSNIPEWFVEKIQWKEPDILVSVDDDQTIHQIWDGRINSLPSGKPVIHHSFTSLIQCKEWMESQDKSKLKFLIDYEFLNQEGSGLDFIEANGIAQQSILVSSRFEESSIQTRAQSMGVKILPKGLAPFAPMVSEKVQIHYDAVLIDDDPIVHSTWEMMAKARGKKLLIFGDVESFFALAEKIDRNSPVYIDVSLGSGIRGEDVAPGVAALDFSKIFLATGYSAKEISKPDCVVAVIGKEPVF